MPDEDRNKPEETAATVNGVPISEDSLTLGKGLLLFFVFLLLIFAGRADHMFGPIDEPHAWRQCDTARYAQGFYEDGINIFHPSVCWMGAQSTVIFEFPLPEVLMASGYKIFGYRFVVARVLTLLFFAGSAFYLYLLIRKVADARLALATTLAYCVFPLSQYYSRAIHIDFYAVFFAHGMTFHLLKSLDDPGRRHLFTGTAFGILGFLIKAPYLFYFVLPLGCMAFYERSRQAWTRLAIGFSLPVVFFAAWRSHVATINGKMPDWGFVPDYQKLVDMGDWYYGSLALRFDLSNWLRLGNRLRYEVLSEIGMVFGAVGLVVLVLAAFRGHRRQILVLAAWILGVAVYVCLFFNLNLRHNYYQIPLLPVAAVVVGAALCLPFRLLGERHRRWALFLSTFCFLLIWMSSHFTARQLYFKVDGVREAAGEIIRTATPEDALIIAAVNAPDTTFSDPRLLFRAGRDGWSVRSTEIPELAFGAFLAEGATHLAVVSTTEELTHIENLGNPFFDGAFLRRPLPGNLQLGLIRLKDTP